MKHLISGLRMASVAAFALAVLVCGAYPCLVWGIAQGLLGEPRVNVLKLHLSLDAR